MSDKKPVTPAKRIKVKLLKATAHGGKPYQVGDAIDVSVNQLPWLRESGLIAKEG